MGSTSRASRIIRGALGVLSLEGVLPCAYQNTKNFGLTFHAVLSDGGPQIRLESMLPRSGPLGVIWRRSFGVK